MGNRATSSLVEHALSLIIRRHSGDEQRATQALDEIDRWRAADPSHETAWHEAQRMWSNTSGTEDLRGHFEFPAARPVRAPSRKRRKALGGLSLLMLGAAAAGVATWHWRQPQFAIALSTRRAQSRDQSLPDGSRIELSAEAELRIGYFRDHRAVDLARGEAAFTVARDEKRPFVITSPWGAVRVVGTVFSVAVRDAQADRPGYMTVSVAEGAVRVWAIARPSAIDRRWDRLDASPPMVELHGGQTVRVEGRIDANVDGSAGAGAGRAVATLGDVAPIEPGDVAAWRQGWLVFDKAPLADVIARWNDFVDPPIALAPSPAMARLRLNGTYPLRDPNTFLSGLPAVLPVKVVRHGDRVRIEAVGR